MDEEYRRALRLLSGDPDNLEFQNRVTRLAHQARRPVCIESKIPNVHPDLILLDEISDPNLSYEFNLLAVWRHPPTGRVFYGQDSGCSCPSPWENDYFKFDGERVDTTLTELTEASRNSFVIQVENFPCPIEDRMKLTDLALRAADLVR